MDYVDLSERDMQVIMMALHNSEEFADDAADLHDRLATEGFDRFAATKNAILRFLGGNQ